MAILHNLHSWLRYAVLLAAVGAMATAVLAISRPAEDRISRLGLTIFAGLLDLQVLLGIVLLVFWPYYPMLIGHIVMMVIAAVVAHAGSITARRRARPAVIRLVTAALALILLVGGIMAIQRPIL
jgi:hypothetical protein